MKRGSRHNPYECPECTHVSTRKYNLGVHMKRVHGLSLPYHLYTSQKVWAWAQRRAFERAYIEAETESEKKKAQLRLYNFLIRWGQKGHWDFTTAIPDALDARRKREEKAAKLTS